MSDLLPSATDYAEKRLEACLLPQTITAIYEQQDIGWFSDQFTYTEPYFGGFGSCRQGWELPRGPIISITSVTDTNGNAITYTRHTAGNAEFIIPTQAVTYAQAPITVVYQAGYSTGVPQSIVNAIRVHVATMFMVREDITNLPANAVHKIDDYYRYAGRGTVIG